MGTNTSAPVTSIPWTNHVPLTVTELNPDSVGYHATTKTVADPSALPVHARERALVNVTNFGADPTGATDSADAVHQAIEHAKTLGSPVTVMFPHGTYKMHSQEMPKRELYVSNTVGRFPEFKVKNIAILLEDMHDVIVDGQGSELVFHGRATQFAVIGSTHVTIKNFSTTWHAPLVLDLTVVASGVEEGRGFRDIKVPSGVGRTIKGPTATFTGETNPATGQPYWSHGPEVSLEWQNQIRDLASGLTLRSPLPLWQGSRAVRELGKNVLRISYDSPEDPGDAGKVYELRQRARDTPGGLIWESTRVELKALHLHYLHGFGIVGQLSRDISLDAITLRAKPGSWNQTAGLADFIQLSGVGGKAQITNCLFDNPHDDPINIHGTYVQVQAIDRDARTVTLKYMERDTAGFPQFYPSDELRFVRRTTMLDDGDEHFRVIAVTGPNGRDSSHDLEHMSVTVDRELPPDLAVEAYVAENMTYTPEVYIAGNTFKSTPTRGILVTTPKPVLIERNYFDQMGMASIYISADADYWYESSGVTNATIRNNVFDRPAAGWAAIWFDPTNAQSEAVRTTHSNITIDANRFMLRPDGSLVKGRSVSNVEFTNNHIDHFAPTFPAAAATNQVLFSFSASHRIRVSGNSYAEGFNRWATLAQMPEAEFDGGSDGIALVPAPAVEQKPETSLGKAVPELCGTPIAGLLPAVWTGASFAAPSSPLAWLAHVGSGITSVEVLLQAADAGTSLFINYNDEKLAPTPDSRYALTLLAGPNVLEVRTQSGDGLAGQTYRWVVIAP